MPTYKLQIREHEEYGGSGIWFNSGRDYFQPAVSGGQFAHDILEHPTAPHENGYIDELLAIGAVLAGRVENNWRNDWRPISDRDIISDICSITNRALMQRERYSDGYGEYLCLDKCNNHLRNKHLTNRIRSNVIRGLLDAIYEYEEIKYETIPEKYDFDIESIVGWICKGYQLFRKRFNNVDLYDVSIFLFDKIARISQDWLDNNLEGAEVKLYVNFTTFEVRLLEEYK